MAQTCEESCIQVWHIGQAGVCSETWHCQESHKVRHGQGHGFEPPDKTGALGLLGQCCQQQKIGRSGAKLSRGHGHTKAVIVHSHPGLAQKVQIHCTVTGRRLGPENRNDGVPLTPFRSRPGGLCLADPHFLKKAGPPEGSWH